MSNIQECKYFLIIKKQKILFKIFDPINGSSLIKEMLVENYFSNDTYNLLEKFLEKNIFEIEKELKDFIKKIYIIFESDTFFEVSTSIKHNLKGISFNQSQLNDALIDIKNQLKKHSHKYEIIHMIINRYIINGVVHDFLPENIDGDDLVIQVNFICLQSETVNDLKKIFSKYEISINKILCYDYLKKLNSYSGENIIKIANDNINRLNANEVFIVKKKLKKQGFFEKFFNFFN